MIAEFDIPLAVGFFVVLCFLTIIISGKSR